MAFSEQALCTIEAAQQILGPAWNYCGEKLQYSIYSSPSDSHDDYRTDLVNTQSVIEVQGKTFTDRHFWPTELECRLKPTSFYANADSHPVHPLLGYPIRRLIEITGYPFHNPDRVVAIPVRCPSTNHLKFDPDHPSCDINPNEPNAVLFIETWTYLDPFDKSEYRRADQAFAITDTVGVIWSKQVNCINDQVGKNFIILPYGYRHYLALGDFHQFTVNEWCNFYYQYAEKWDQIIHDFFHNGESNQDTLKIKLPSSKFEDWQEELRELWRPKFLSPKNLEIIQHSCEAFFEETSNGLKLYTMPDIATPKFACDKSLNETYEMINYSWYRVTEFNYCQKHYRRYIGMLSSLQNDFNADHECIAEKRW